MHIISGLSSTGVGESRKLWRAKIKDQIERSFSRERRHSLLLVLVWVSLGLSPATLLKGAARIIYIIVPFVSAAIA